MVGTVEGFLARKEQKELPPGNLSEHDKELVGPPAQLEVPFTDLYKLVKVVDMMQGYAAMVKQCASRSDVSTKSALFELKGEFKMLNKRVRRLYPELFKKRWPGDFIE